jgi:hypothetical protein
MAASPPQEKALMAKLVKRVEEFAESPKAKDLEKKMLRKAECPKTRAKIAKRLQEVAQEFLNLKVSAPVRNRANEISNQDRISYLLLMSFAAVVLTRMRSWRPSP